ncbi:MAG: hypothetical protein GY945_07470 [Rhodobacteraceae bacterium]|nr:hypothetical protein [Paracoccaceae bacterium]
MKTGYFTAPLCLSLSLCLPAMAGTKDDNERDHTTGPGGTPPVVNTIPASTIKDPVERFVESNVLETLYHEMGHALIDTMNLSVFGPEEFAVDFFAAILMERVHDEVTTRQLFEDVTHAYRADDQSDRAAGVETSSWDNHGKPMQRYYNMACLFYGADPDGRKHALELFNLPDGRADSCAEEFEQANFAWGGVLEELSEGTPGTSITLDWILDNDSHLTQYVTREVAALNRMLVMPEPITVSVIPCGEVNAYYDPDPREIIICTELSDHLAGNAP